MSSRSASPWSRSCPPARAPRRRAGDSNGRSAEPVPTWRACSPRPGAPRARVGRVGTDGFGDHLVEAIAAYGVDTSAVRRDPARPTGIYFRTAGNRASDAHEVASARAGSAASAMTKDNVDLDALRSGRVLHLSGITAALSEDCLGLMRELAARARRPLVLPRRQPPRRFVARRRLRRVLLDLARGADIVFVGHDEARAAWGCPGHG